MTLWHRGTVAVWYYGAGDHKCMPHIDDTYLRVCMHIYTRASPYDTTYVVICLRACMRIYACASIHDSARVIVYSCVVYVYAHAYAQEAVAHM